MRNYFEIFGLSPSYHIDLDQLDATYRRVQSIVHPDKFALASQAEKRSAMQLATLANDAYATLKDPLKRAVYLCGLHDLPINTETASKLPPAFLMQQMDLREALEDAQRAKNLEALKTIEQQQHIAYDEQVAHIATLFDKNALTEAAEETKKLMFIKKFNEEIRNIIDSLH